MGKLTIIKYFASTRWAQKYASRRDLEAYQLNMLQDHLDFLRRHSSYFKGTPDVSSLAGLSRLPVMDKAVMMKHFDAMNTVGINKAEALKLAIKSERTRDFTPTIDGVSVGLSSGTSGHRGLFIISDDERYGWAGMVLARFLPEGKLFGHRIAFFLRANNNLYETVNSPLIRFRYFDIYAGMDENIAQLENYRPSILVAPPSVLSLIADRVEAGSLNISPLKVISVAEVLEPGDEARFKIAFRQKIIFQAYQCTEGFLAYTCAKGSLHLNEDSIIFEKEYIGKRRFIPIITDFRRRSQPIVRYRLNDVLLEDKKKCGCGCVLATIKRVEGREDDIFIFKDSFGNEVRVFSDMIGRCMLYASGFDEYKVVQTSHQTLDIHIDRVTAASKAAIKKEFDRLAHEFSFEKLQITYKPYKPDLSKKLKRIERAF